VASAANHLVEDNPAASRYELQVAGQLAGRIDYRLGDGTISMNHAEVEPALRGQGLGQALAAGALADVEKRGLKVIPRCPFVVAYLKRHPELQHLVLTSS
jgi:uncharacterized protein